MIMTRPLVASAMTAALVLAACAAPAGTPAASPTDTATTRPPFETTASSPGDDPVPDGPDGLPVPAWTAIVEDLAMRLGEPVVDPTVVQSETMTWNDGSLGCPKPGQVYTQALVDGYQVVVEVDGVEYDYRVGNGTDVRLCEGPPIEGG